MKINRFIFIMMTFTYYSPDPLVFSQKTTHNLVTLRSCIFLTNKLVTLAPRSDN